MRNAFKIKITPQKINFYFFLSIITIIIIILFLISLFLYKNFYQTITQSEEVLILRGQLAFETIDINKFEEVIEKIKQKTASREPGSVNNPFD
ncbi:hypothetical protein HY798_01065 [Candidatus Falkowbacteria bacterium]|nr:hypothetical protein [Candidatus Falkowbacteria bacterium]